MDYIELSVKITPFNEEVSDIIIFELSEIDYESFTTDNDILKAYIQEVFFDIKKVNNNNVINNFKNKYNISFTNNKIVSKDWNAEWESNFKPLIIDNTVYIRASFHEKNNTCKYDIVIDPKMSFGTGHHSTTSNMIKYILESDIEGKNVLDMGCGTSLLGIFSSMRGATSVTGIDIDEWAYNNSIENIELNNIKNLNVFLGDANSLKAIGKFDIILANINRNILLYDMDKYVDVLKKGGELIMSGFYTEDLDIIQKKAKDLELKYVSHKVDLNWVAVKFIK